MFVSKDNRELKVGQKVKIYRNLKNNKWSIVDYKTGLVLGYSDIVYLKNVRFIVNQSGRKRVLKEKRKNVHAYVVGEFISHQKSKSINVEIYYDPYKHANFIHKENSKLLPIFSENALLLNNKVFI